MSIGSCFVQHAGKKLKSTGYNIPYIDSGEGIKYKALSTNYGNIYTLRFMPTLIAIYFF